MRVLKSIIFIFFISMALFVLVKPGYAATVIAPSSISTNITWTSDNIYVVQSSTTVQPGITLTVQPGTVVKFQSSSYMYIKGTLQASGTSDNNIIFTSYKDDTYGGDTNGDGTSTTPAKGDWNCIQSYTGGNINCSYNRIRYGGKYAAMVYSAGGGLNIVNCIIEKSNTRGIEIKGTSVINNNQLYEFTTTGIYVNSGSSTISGNNISGGIYGIYVVDGSPNIVSNTINNNTQKSVYVINGSPIISDNTINGGDLTSNYGIVVENGTVQITGNNIAHFPSYEAIQLGKLLGTNTGVYGSISGNTMSACKYPLGFVGDKISTITFESNSFSDCSIRGIYLNVDLTGTQSISAYSLPYVISSLLIKTGTDISIAPGTIFKLTTNGLVTILGTLTAEGDASNPIVFTSFKDDSYGGDTNDDGTSTLPQPGDWSYITISNTGKAVFDRVIFCCGVEAIYAYQDGYELTVKNCDISRMSYYGINVIGANALIESNKIHDNGYGIYCGNLSSPKIINNDIYNNSSGIRTIGSCSAVINDNYIHNNVNGIFIMMDSTSLNNCQIDHNNIVDNTSYGLYTWLINNPPVVVAQYNWWGDPSGPYPIGNGNPINSTTKIDASNPLPKMYVPEAPEDGAKQFCRQYDPEKRKWSLVLEPVDSGTGAHVIAKGLISLNGTRPLDFSLSYNSLLLDQGALGKGWGHNYETRLEAQSDGSLKLCWSANRDNLFTTTNQVNYTSVDSACRLDSLVKNSDGTYTLTRKNQSKFYFDASGRLTEEKSGIGLALQMSYDSNGKLETITEPLSGIGLDLSYNTNGLLQSATDNLARQWQFTYDPSNNLTAISYPDGTSSTFTYNAAGQVLSETDPQGNLLFSNIYDSQGRVISQDDGISSNQLSTIAYDDTTQPGYLIATITDRNGHSRKYIHDTSYQLIKVIDELGNETTLTYDEDGNRTGITDAAGHTTTMTYDDRGNILTSTDAGGKTTTMTYDNHNNLLTVQNALGKTVTNTYDTNNRLVTISDPDNHQTTFAYNSNGLLTGKTSPRGGTTSYTYVNGLLQTTTDPTGRAATMAYDAAGRLLSTTDAAGKTTAITYDAMNRIMTTTDPLGNVISFTYDGKGKVLTQTDARGNTTTYTYDGNRNLSSITDALGNITSFGYDGEDRLTQVTDPRGNHTTITYDAKGRTTSITDALSHTLSTQYDAVDNVTAQFDALNNQVASITYDELNRPISVTDALGNTTTNTYDALGNLTQTTNPLNQSSQFSYDNLNRLIETVDALNGEAAQEFDADGNWTALIDTNSNRQDFTFDLAGRLTESSSATGTLQYTYNQIGLLSSLTNGRGQIKSLQYDDAGRPVSQTDPDGTISCTYDVNGNLLTITDASGTITRQYDALNRVTSYTDTRGNTIEYDYDANGNLTCLTYPDDKEVHYTYDDANRLTQVQDWAGRITTYTYDANNRLTETNRPDGSVETRTYDTAGRLTQQLDKDQNDNILTQFDFAYNAAGNITEETNNLPETPLPDEETNMTYTTDNRLATYNGTSVTYDADGNLTSGLVKVLSPDVSISSYEYDSRNRLIDTRTVSNSVYDAYTYDAENNRIAVTSGGQSTQYVINPTARSQVLMKTDPDETETYYVYGLGLIGEETGENYKSYHYDLRGSTVAITDITGAVTNTFQYGPYGEVQRISGTTSTPFLYNGRDGVMTDANGFYYMRA